MKSIKNISIPEPCHQSWQQMTPVDGGRHCESCCKTVVDFTAMADVEIINFISRNTDTCGRFRRVQVENSGSRYNRQISELKPGWRKWVITSLVFSFINIYEAKAQTRQIAAPVHQISSNNRNSEKIDCIKSGTKRPLKFKTITGIVKDGNGMPVFSATVAIAGTEYWSQTDSCGNFKLIIPASTKKVTVSLGDYHDEIVFINDNQLSYEVELKYEGMYFAGLPKINNALKVARPILKFDFRPVFRKLFN